MEIEIPKEVINKFEMVVAFFNKNSEADCGECNNPIIGKLWWKIPDDVLWLYSTNNEENYEGSQTQIGIKKDGTVVWGFFSHCSCYYYERYKGKVEKFENNEETYKQYEMENVDKDVIIIINKKLELIKDYLNNEV